MSKRSLAAALSPTADAALSLAASLVGPFTPETLFKASKALDAELAAAVVFAPTVAAFSISKVGSRMSAAKFPPK